MHCTIPILKELASSRCKMKHVGGGCKNWPKIGERDL